ncbi:SPOR domain-containing protein [Deltaproteobacteria bacterium]|nr:SPOR domain-containing protein [Deltaproteobacteria bacterium]
MKFTATIIPIWVMLFIIGPGCSKEEAPLSFEKTAAVRKAIEMPVREEAGDAKVTREPEPGPVAEKEVVETAVPIEENKPEKLPESVEEAENGYYVTKKGDSLSGIAGREDVYGDILKWPILYSLNMAELDDIEKDENFPDREMPEGIRLKILTPDEVKENLEKKPKNYWVINVISSSEKERIVPHIIKLIMNGYGAYITRIEVDGKDWMRLRVGFYKDKEEAEEEGEKVMAVLKFSDIWTTKVGDVELGEFGGY